MTLAQAQAIYRQAVKVAIPPDDLNKDDHLHMAQARELKKLAKMLAEVGGFEVWEIEE